MKVAVSWSGGKDSAMMLYELLQMPEVEVAALSTTFNAGTERVIMHGVRRELIEAQAAAAGVALVPVHLPDNPSNKAYEDIFSRHILELKEKYSVEAIAFGDIFLEDLRRYRENMLAKAGLKGIFPLWGSDPQELVQRFIGLGFKAITVCVDENILGPTFLGQVLDEQLIARLPENADPCGENGEYHSYVFAGPLFKENISFVKGETVKKSFTDPPSHFLYQDILLA